MFGIMILIKQRDINISFIKDQIKDYLIMGEKNQLKYLLRKKYHHDHSITLFKTKVYLEVRGACEL